MKIYGLYKFWTHARLGNLVGFTRKPYDLNISLLFQSGAITAFPVNCWLSRTLRLFRRFGQIMPAVGFLIALSACAISPEAAHIQPMPKALKPIYTCLQSLYHATQVAAPSFAFDSYAIETTFANQPGAVAFYDVPTKIVYLRDYWDADNAIDRVSAEHELTHHILGATTTLNVDQQHEIIKANRKKCSDA